MKILRKYFLIAVLLAIESICMEKLSFGVYPKINKKDESLFFSIDLSNHDSSFKDSIRIKCVAESGNPVVYASTLVIAPSKEVNEYTSNDFDGKSIFVLPSRIGNSNIIYFSVYCSEDCNYSLTLDKSNFVPIQKGSTYSMLTLNSESEMNLIFKSEIGFDWLLFSVDNSPLSVEFYKLDSKNVELEAKSGYLKTSNFFIGDFGYIMDEKDEEFCSECIYKINLKFNTRRMQNTSSITYNTKVYFTLRDNNNLQDMDMKNTLYTIVEQSRSKCFELEIPGNFSTNDALIVSILVFSGTLNFNVYSSYPPKGKPIFSQDVAKNKVYKLDYITLDADSFERCYLCLSSELIDTSIVMTVKQESQIGNEYQYYKSLLIDGIPTQAYLPSKHLDSYYIVDLQEGVRDIEVNLTIESGELTLYAIICNDNNCGAINKDDIINGVLKPNYLTANDLDLDSKNIQIQKESIKCVNIEDCGVTILLVCLGDTECIGQVSFNYDDNPLIIRER